MAHVVSKSLEPASRYKLFGTWVDAEGEPGSCFSSKYTFGSSTKVLPNFVASRLKVQIRSTKVPKVWGMFSSSID